MATPPPPFTVLRGHDDAVVSLKFIGSNCLFSGGANGTMKLWNLTTQRCSKTIHAHEKSILSISSISPQEIITSSRDSTLKLWDINRMESPSTVLRTGYDHFCNSTVLPMPEGRSIVVAPGIQQSQIFLWDVRAASDPVRVISPDTSISGDVGMITALSTFNCGTEEGWNIAAGYEDGSLHIFDIRANQSSLCSRKLHSEPIFALAVSTRITKQNQNQNQKQHVGQIRGICNTERESERQVLVTTGGGDASLQRTVLNNSIQHQPDAKGMVGNMVLDSMDSVNLPHPGTSCVRYRSDGRLLVSTHWDYTVRIFDQKRLKPLAILRHHRDSVYAVDFVEESAYPYINDGKLNMEQKDTGTTSVPTDVHHNESYCNPKVDNMSSNDQAGAGGKCGEEEEKRGLSRSVFATASKDCTIALWDLFADSFH